MSGAVVLFSGGQDSTTCLAWAIHQFGRQNVHPVSFFYGQKHTVELACAEEIANHFGINTPVVLKIPVLSDLAGAALTNPDIEVEAVASETSGNQFAYAHGLPSTFVPGRNMLFLTLAAAFGAQRGIYDLVTGVCEADASGYPDCRASFILAASHALSEALDDSVRIHAPLIEVSKTDTWRIADELGVLKVVVDMTHTCYHGVHDEEHFHAWGYGCGECPACLERKKGYEEYMVSVGA